MLTSPTELALYIHWPYCSRICPYCDFNVYKAREDSALVGAIIADMERWRDWSGPRRLTSIHFGGGTPSLLPADDIAALINRATELWATDDNIEIALEANPSDADEARWNSYKQNGVNRLSLGAQSFENNILAFLGRNHDSEQASHAAELAGKIFPSLSFDLIFGSVGQTPNALQADLDMALSYDPDHLSTYQLTIEPGTAFEKSEARGEHKAVETDDSAAFYDQISQTLIAAGFEHYEISNFAKPGHRSRHNLTYWRGGDYVGVGRGAHGRITIEGLRYATVAPRTSEAYTTSLRQADSTLFQSWGGKTLMTSKDIAEEYLFMGLRIDEGVSMSRYKHLSGEALPERTLNELIQDGWLDMDADRLKVTPKGRLVLDQIIKTLLVT